MADPVTRYEVYVDVQGIERLRKLSDVWKEIGHVGGIAGAGGGFQGLGIRDLNKEMSDFKNKMEIAAKASRRFKFEWLGVMFFSMMVNRVFTKLFKNMLDTFKQIAGKSHPLNMALTRLNASFTFLKFSIIEAMGPLLERFVIWLAEMAIAIAEMDPAILNAIGLAIIGIAAVAGVGLIASQLKLFYESLLLLGSADAATGLALLKGFAKLGQIVVTITLLIEGFKLLTTESDIWDYLSFTLISGLAGIIFGIKAGPTGMLIGGLVGLALGIEVSILDFLMEEGSSLTLWQKLAAVLVSTLAGIGIGARAGVPGMIIGGIIGLTLSLKIISSTEEPLELGKLAFLETADGLEKLETKQRSSLTWWEKLLTQWNLATYALTGGSLVPSVDLLNIALTASNVLVPQLTLALPALTLATDLDAQAHYRNAAAINAEAAAISNLNSARSGSSSSRSMSATTSTFTPVRR